MHSIKSKLMCFFSALFIITIVVSAVINSKLSSLRTKREIQEAARESIASLNKNIEDNVRNISNYSKLILSDAQVQSILSGKALGDNRQKSIVLNQTMYTYLNCNTDISSIYILDNDKRIYGVDSQYTKGLAKKTESTEELYQQLNQDVRAKKGKAIFRINAGGCLDFKPTERVLSLIREINHLETQQPIGKLIINMPIESIITNYNEYKTYGKDLMIIRNHQDYIIMPNIYHTALMSQAQRQIGENEKEGVGFLKYDQNEYIYSFIQNRELGWQIISASLVGEALKGDTQYSMSMLALILTNSLLIILGTFGIARLITRPIDQLLNTMNRTQKGHFEQVERNYSRDEIDRLKEGYNHMIVRIEELIETIKNEQQKKRKEELNVLQAQIKPHFLYNTLDAISALALLDKKQEVYTIVKALGSYYRGSLSKGKEVITLREEIEIVKNYLIIQRIRYKDIFWDEYDLEPEVLDCHVLKLMLQPLVENALYHGIKPMGTMGIIGISAKLVEEGILISVEDDGVGMEQERLNHLLEGGLQEGQSFGLLGTLERMRIFYEGKCKTTITTEVNQGMRIEIILPFLKADQLKEESRDEIRKT